MSTFSMFLLLLGGISWSIVYVACIKVGIKDKTYAIPFWALALNFAWEAMHSLYGISEIRYNAQVMVNVLWTILDCGIIYTYFKYGAKEFPSFLNKHIFISFSILSILISLVFQYAFIKEFSIALAGSYSAFIQNLLMSVLFIAMLLKRQSSKGQNLTIAIFKWLGTLALAILFGVIGSKDLGGKPNQFIFIMGIIICLIDMAYIYLLYKMQRAEKELKLKHLHP